MLDMHRHPLTGALDLVQLEEWLTNPVIPDLPLFEYPWGSLGDYLLSRPDSMLPVIGYGSLMNRDSASRTIPECGGLGFVPVGVAGARRVFNYCTPLPVLARRGGEFAPEQIAALNVEITGNVLDVVTGNLIPLHLSDLDGFREREFGYDLHPVRYAQLFSHELIVGEAWLLTARERFCNGRRVTDDQILPNPRYLEICRTGAGGTSPKFHELFLDTTVLADRATRLRDYLA